MSEATHRNCVELWLVRHGQTVANASGMLSGSLDVPLTAHGEAQARALAPLLAAVTFDSATASDLVRARQTARLAWGEVATDPRLREMAFGELEGRPWIELPATAREGIERFQDYTAPGGESVSAVRARIGTFVAELKPGRHLVFTHGGIVRLLTQPRGLDRFVANGALVRLRADTLDPPALLHEPAREP